MNSSVLDASAVLALLNAEPGSDSVEAALLHPDPCALCAVNLAEVVAKLAEAGMPEEAIRETLGHLRIDVLAFDVQDAYAAGLLRAGTRAHGLSLGDRACLALAKRLDLPVLTADRRWSQLDLGLRVELLR